MYEKPENFGFPAPTVAKILALKDLGNFIFKALSVKINLFLKNLF